MNAQYSRSECDCVRRNQNYRRRAACGVRWLASRPTSRQDVKKQRDAVPVPGLILIGKLEQFFDVEAGIGESFGYKPVAGGVPGRGLPASFHECPC